MRARWWLLAGLVAAAFAWLGLWQLGRAREKRALIADAQAVLARREAVPLAHAADPVLAKRLEWGVGQGRFAEGPLLLLDNQLHAGQAGVRAYRVFLPNGGDPLLVDLGWLPLGRDRTQLPALAAPSLTTVQGLLAPPPAPGLVRALATVQASGAILTTAIDAPGLPALLGQPPLAPRVLRLDPALPGGGARDLDVLPNTMPPERHIAYAVQWFALALAVLVVTFLSSRRAHQRHALRA